MKKVLYFAAIAAMFAACSSEELEQSALQQDAKGTPINFSAYTPRNTRAGVAGTNDNTNIGTRGFGVFAYYTAGEKYDVKSTPNFMYNQKVTTDLTVNNQDDAGKGGGVGAGKAWTYEPVKYWPNEFGDKAISDDVDYLTFFAYAPWVEVTPTTGEIVPKGATEAEKLKEQNYNITNITKNSAQGDPIIKYVVDTDPATSVDLLWGVVAADAADNYTAIDAAKAPTLTAGLPFKDLIKPAKSATDKVLFNLRHALAKIKITIDYVADADLQDNVTPTETKEINADETRIYVRSVTLGGFATEGALNLNNTTADKPLWKALDGVNDLNFDDITFYDGRKDGKEGTTSGEAASEKPQGLNPDIIENTDTKIPVETKWTDSKTKGVTKWVADAPVLLFGGKATDNNGYFYVIPRDADQGVDITINYDVQTIDGNLAEKLADGATLGSLIQNVITKQAIFGASKDIEAGKVYEINIHLGMTSVKIDASVRAWDDPQSQAQPALPYNTVTP